MKLPTTQLCSQRPLGRLMPNNIRGHFVLMKGPGRERLGAPSACRVLLVRTDTQAARTSRLLLWVHADHHTLAWCYNPQKTQAAGHIFIKAPPTSIEQAAIHTSMPDILVPFLSRDKKIIPYFLARSDFHPVHIGSSFPSELDRGGH